MKLHSTFDDPLCEIWQGDCRAIIERNQVAWKGAFDFVFADPPFNIGHGYDVYKDTMSAESFYAFTMEWLGACVHLLRDGGVMVVHVPDDMVWMPLITMRPDVAGMTRIDWVIWHYRFAVNQSLDTATGFLSSKAHGLVFRKSELQHTFNAAAVKVESDRKTKYNDNRINETVNGGYRIPFDVWSGENDGMHWGRINGNNSERRANHPNQLPERYIERYVRAYTNPNEYCFDPFGGTGTTAVVASELGRNVVTCELSKAYCDDIANRVSEGAKRVDP